MTINKTLALPLAALITATTSAYAQADEGWSGDVEFGYVSASGNTDESSLKIRAEAKHEQGDWRYLANFDSLNSESDDQATAEKYFLSGRAAYQFNEHDFIFAYLSYDDDRFSGYDYQATAAIGYGRRLLKNEVMQWDVEIGPGYRYSTFDDNSVDSSSEAVLRLATNFDWEISETASFKQTLGIESGEDNTVTKAVSALKVSIIGALALKLSFSVKNNTDVPVGTEKTDTETAVTVSYSF